MHPKWETINTDLQKDLTRCLTLEHPEKENVENCFWIAKNYWERLQTFVTEIGFRNDEDEISFYRKVKPKFASYIEYFSMLSEGLMFVPPWIPLPVEFQGKIDEGGWRYKWQDNVKDYWILEEVRGKRFYSKNKAFIEYCESDCTQQDEAYFLARNRPIGEISQRRSHNRDTELFTVHEEILTTWEAYKLYSAYIKKKVNEPVGR